MNQLDQDVHDLKERKKMLMSLERLMQNQDFRLVILKNFLNEHPLKLVYSKGRIPLDPQVALNIDRQLDCVAMFKLYLESTLEELSNIDFKIMEAEQLRDDTIQGKL